jgi:hypothetical protein
MPELIDVEPGTPGWLAYRKTGVTATDVVTILGLSHWDSVYSLFWRKRGEIPDEPDRDRFALGRHMEPYIVGKWEEVNGYGTCPGGLWRNSARPWQLATPDQLYSANQRTEVCPLEVKSWADADRRSWEPGPPAAVRAQLLWQMDTLDAPVGYWGVVFLPSGRFAHGTIEHDPAVPLGYDVTHTLPGPICDLCADILMMRLAGHEFHSRMLGVLPPPDPDVSAATTAALKARFTPMPGKQAEIELGTWNAWYGAKTEEDRWARLRHQYETDLRVQAGEATELTVNGEVVIKRIVGSAPVKAHTRHSDYYRNMTKREDNDDLRAGAEGSGPCSEADA